MVLWIPGFQDLADLNCPELDEGRGKIALYTREIPRETTHCFPVNRPLHKHAKHSLVYVPSGNGWTKWQKSSLHPTIGWLDLLVIYPTIYPQHVSYWYPHDIPIAHGTQPQVFFAWCSFTFTHHIPIIFPGERNLYTPYYITLQSIGPEAQAIHWPEIPIISQ